MDVKMKQFDCTNANGIKAKNLWRVFVNNFSLLKKFPKKRKSNHKKQD